MKKILTATLAVALVFGATGAFAQTMTVSADPDGAGGNGPYTQVFDSPVGLTFDLVVWMDTAGEPSSAAEFVMSELLLVAPGILKTGTLRINNTQLDLGDNARGEYIIAFGGCEPPSSDLLMVRVTYIDLGTAVGSDVVLTLRGFELGDSQPSSFAGAVGFVDCSDNKVFSVMGGTDGGITGADVVFPDGGLVLNPTPIAVPTAGDSMGQLKARF